MACLMPAPGCHCATALTAPRRKWRALSVQWRSRATVRRSGALRVATALLALLAAALGYGVEAEARVREPVLSRIAASGTLRLGARVDSIPFSYRLPDGRATGYSMELCLHLAEQLRKRLRLPRLQPEVLFLANVQESVLALKDDRIDIECGVTADTAERRKDVSFSLPHFFSYIRVIGRAELNIDRLGQLAGRRVAVPRATVSHRLLLRAEEQMYPRPQIVDVDSAEQGFKLLASGEVDAFASFEAQLMLWRARQPDPQRYRIGGELVHLDPVALMLPRDDQAFLRAVDVILSHAMIDGVLTRLYKRWFEEPVPPDGLLLAMPMSELLRSGLAAPARLAR